MGAGAGRRGTRQYRVEPALIERNKPISRRHDGVDPAEAVQTLRQQACILVLAKCTETFLPLCLTDNHDPKIYPTAGCTSDQELASDH